MNPKTLSAIVVAAIIVIAGGLFVATKPSSQSQNSQNTQSNQISAPDPAPQADQFPADSKKYTADDVATHASEDDCWTIIDDVVYDITPYVPRHPGGDDFLMACGKDGSRLFNQRQTSDGEEVGSGMPHSSRAAGQLKELQIGLLQN